MAAPVDPEFLLATACCRWPPDATRDAAVRAAAEGVDWVRFGAVVQRQRIAGLAATALASAGIAPPDEIADAIKRRSRQMIQQNLVAAAETARLTALIAAAGHPVLAIKGVVLGMLAYGSIALKHSKDVDLLVLPEHAGAVIALLEADGYALSFPVDRLSSAQRAVLPAYGKDVTMHKANGATQVELHWRLFDSKALLPGVTALSSAQHVELGGQRSAPTLAQPDLYAYLVLHGATDGWSRLKWLADVNALIAPLDDSAIEALHARAVTLGAGSASAQALLLMHDLFGRALPPSLAQMLGRSRGVRMLVAGAYRMMAPPDGTRETSDWWRGQLLSLAMQPLLGRSLRHQAQIVRAVLYSQPEIYASRLPPRLYALHPLIRVPHWVIRRVRLPFGSSPRRGKSATISAKS